MLNFCTLFDSYYLDKGIALYRSLEKVSEDFALYIFCFDDASYKILKGMNFPRAIILHHSDFETPEYLELKKVRSKAEYCWTCTPVIIEYVLDHYPVDSCTYLDSDLYFYANPQQLYDEIFSCDADVVIVEHRFKDDSFGRKMEKRNGKYCVEFNYFCKSDNSKAVLRWWKDKCFEWCYDIPEPDRMGDQKYLNYFPELFEGVHELRHLGGGVAPWNLELYEYVNDGEDGSIRMRDKSGHEFSLVFYHFQNIRYLPGRKANIKSQTRSKSLKYRIYIPYLKEVEAIRHKLTEDYGIDFDPKRLIRSSNPIVGFLQKYFAGYKVRHISDIVNLDRLDGYNIVK